MLELLTLDFVLISVLYRETDLTMEVFDIIGRKTLEGHFPNQAIGTHIYNLNMNDKPSGIYFCRISTSTGHSETIKIMMIK